jgi:hypothetical protein
MVSLAEIGQVGHRCQTAASRRTAFTKQQEAAYEKQSAVLARPNQGGALFDRFCHFNDVVAARLGPATSTAISAFHKPAGS